MEISKNDSVLSILAVSSEQNLCSALTAVPENECRVFSASTVLKALDMLSQTPFDILLADLEECRKDMVKLFVMAKKKEPGVHPVVALDAEAEIPAGKISENSMITFIRKPVSAADFDQKVRTRMRAMGRQKHPLTMFDVVLLYSLCRETLMLTVTRQSRTEKISGTIYFETGGISSAVYGSLPGEEAFYEIMRWKDVRFTERRGETAKSRDITRPMDDLLLEVIRNYDREMRMMETQEFRVDNLISDSPVSAVPEKGAGEPNTGEEELTALACRVGISKILKELKERMDSLENAVVTDREGFMLAGLYPETAGVLHSIMMNTLKFCYKQSLWPESEGLAEMIIFCRKGITMLFPVPDKWIIGITARHHNFGLIRQEGENTAAMIGKIFR